MFIGNHSVINTSLLPIIRFNAVQLWNCVLHFSNIDSIFFSIYNHIFLQSKPTYNCHPVRPQLGFKLTTFMSLAANLNPAELSLPQEVTPIEPEHYLEIGSRKNTDWNRGWETKSEKVKITESDLAVPLHASHFLFLFSISTNNLPSLTLQKLSPHLEHFPCRSSRADSLPLFWR